LKNERKKDEIIRDKSFFYTALVLFIIFMVLNFPFPHQNAYGQVNFIFFDIPIRTEIGIRVIGIVNLLLLVSGLIFLSKSLKKYRIRYILLVLILTPTLPIILVDLYQKTLASGIYAISYEENKSICRIETSDPNTLHGTCEFIFENYSKNDVPFEITFYDQYQFAEDNPVISLMNNEAPYKVLLEGKKRKTIIIETDIPKKNNYMESGETTIIHLIIEQGKMKRNL